MALIRLSLILLLAHAYVAARLFAAAYGTGYQWLAPAGLALLYVLILGVMATRRRKGSHAGDVLAWLGFLSLGAFSWLFVLTLLRDLCLVLVDIARAVAPVAIAPAFDNFEAISAVAVPCAALLAVLLGLLNARRTPRIVDVTIKHEGLPDALQGFSIVQITDLHVGPTIKSGYVQRVVHAANRCQPDVIVLTGDLVDASPEHLAPHVQPLAELQAGYGVYAVTGNHEYYCGVDAWVPKFRDLGMRVLMNEHTVIQKGGATVVLAGVTDYTAEKFTPDQASNPVKALHGAPDAAAIRIVLAHQPRSAMKAAQAGFDLQLSGHTHGGQFWPWQYFVPLQQPFVAGLHHVGKLLVYVSRGTGYWGPPMRLGARSEITRIFLN